MVQSVSAGENFSSRSQGFNFGFELVLDDLEAYQNHKMHVSIRDSIIKPLVQENGVLAMDWEYPRAIAEHKIGKEIGTPDVQRWDPQRTNQDITITHNSISPKGDAAQWRVAVASAPIRSHGYVDFTINLNPKPDHRGIEIGIITHKDFESTTVAGANFTQFKSGLAWSCNGGFVSGIPNLKEFSVTPVKWEHDHQIGIFVDVEKGILQFFLDRKKHGPVIHLKEVFGNEVYFAVATNTPNCKIDAHFSATCPKVFLG